MRVVTLFALLLAVSTVTEAKKSLHKPKALLLADA